jgi:HSP90 family molecular chaperone
VKAECRRVEAYMKKQAQQQLEQTKEAFQLQLKEALHDVRIEFEVEKMLAIRESREEEINNAVEEAARMAKMEETKRKKIILEAEKEKAVSSTKLVSIYPAQCNCTIVT